MESTAESTRPSADLSPQRGDLRVNVAEVLRVNRRIAQSRARGNVLLPHRCVANVVARIGSFFRRRKLVVQGDLFQAFRSRLHAIGDGGQNPVLGQNGGAAGLISEGLSRWLAARAGSASRPRCCGAASLSAGADAIFAQATDT